MQNQSSRDCPIPSSYAEIRGRDWTIRPTQVSIPMQPAELRSKNLIDGRISISFDNYKAASTSSRIHYNNADDETFSDEEEIRSHTIAVNIQLTDESENEAEELRENLNSYFQDIYISEEGVEMPYPQKPQKEFKRRKLDNWTLLLPNVLKMPIISTNNKHKELGRKLKMLTKAWFYKGLVLQ